MPWTSCSIYATGGLPTVVVVDVGSFALSAALIAAIRTPARPEQLDAPMDGVSAWGGATGEWRAGMHLVGHDRALRVIFLSTGVGMLGEGTFSVGYTPLVIDVLQGGAAGAGALASAQAIGGLLAGALVARAALEVSPRILLAGGMIGLGLTDLGVANAGALASPGAGAVLAASGFMLLAGFPVVAATSARHGLLQLLTTDAFRGQVFGALGAAQGLAILIGLGFGGLAIDAVGVVPVVSVGAAMWIAGGVFVLFALPRDAGSASTIDQINSPPAPL